MKSTTGTTPDIPIIHEDPHLLIIDKPHDLLSQKDHTGDPDVLTLCKAYLRQKNSTSNNPFLGLVHRLDRPVGGLMVLAKTSNAASKLSKQLRNRTIQKTYHAVVQGSPPANGFLTHHLIKNRDTNIVETTKGSNPGGKEAQLSFQRLSQQQALALLAIHLQTGRPHQIRVQLAEEGYPVWGDYKYGRQQPDGRTMALRAVELRFDHPAEKHVMHLKLMLPEHEPWTHFEQQIAKQQDEI